MIEHVLKQYPALGRKMWNKTYEIHYHKDKIEFSIISCSKYKALTSVQSIFRNLQEEI